MEHTGVTDVLARGLAGSTGNLFPLFAAWIGGVSSFMTGSNTNSNVVFGALQPQTAELLGISSAVIPAAQTAGAGLASVAAPAKVVVGASTAGMAGKEGEVMRKLAAYIGVLVMFVGLLALLWAWIGG